MMDYKSLKTMLEEKIVECDQVFITPHLNADFDAIASAIGVSLIAAKYKKPAYIIFADDVVKIEPGVKLIMSEYPDKTKFINLERYLQLKGENDLLVTVDVNKTNLIGVKDYLDDFKNIIIIDHHGIDDKTIKTDPNKMFVSVDESSATEIVAEVLAMLKMGYDANVANIFLAGIYLDTDHLRKNTTYKTMRLVAKLLEKGASIDTVDGYFAEDFLSDRKVQALINKANFFTYTIALAIEDDDVQYTREELAKVADYLLKFKADATIAAGCIDDELISISARSKGKINVGEMMKAFDGGGNVCNAATKIEGEPIKEVEKRLIKELTPKYYILEKDKKA